jgi:hypothetical protein
VSEAVDGPMFIALCARPVLQAPCGECGSLLNHAPECTGEPRPLTMAQALARAQASADKLLRDRVKRYLRETGCPRRFGALAAGKFCSPCRGNPRYPDHRCAEHTAHLDDETPTLRRAADNDESRWLGVWRGFFERVDAILKSG